MYRSIQGIVVLGDGLLGTEIQSQLKCDIISRKQSEFDITKPETWYSFFIETWHGTIFVKKYNTVINCIANTDSYSDNKDEHWNVNYKFVHELINFCNKWDIKLIHIGTDYLYAGNDKHDPTEDDVPVHAEYWYSYTKLLAGGIVQLLSNDYLICRCTHKPYPFPYETAFVDRIGNFDYTHKIVELIIQLIEKNASGIYNIGTESKSIYDLVHRDNKHIKKAYTPDGFPTNTSMSIDKLNNLLNE